MEELGASSQGSGVLRAGERILAREFVTHQSENHTSSLQRIPYHLVDMIKIPSGFWILCMFLKSKELEYLWSLSGMNSKEEVQIHDFFISQKNTWQK